MAIFFLQLGNKVGSITILDHQVRQFWPVFLQPPRQIAERHPCSLRTAGDQREFEPGVVCQPLLEALRHEPTRAQHRHPPVHLETSVGLGTEIRLICAPVVERYPLEPPYLVQTVQVVLEQRPSIGE